MGISLLALILYGSVSSPIVQDLRDSEDDDDDDDKPGLFLFPLYKKWRNPQKGVELKLGSFVDMDKGDLASLIEDEVGDPKTNNLLASNKKVDSSCSFGVDLAKIKHVSMVMCQLMVTTNCEG